MTHYAATCACCSLRATVKTEPALREVTALLDASGHEMRAIWPPDLSLTPDEDDDTGGLV